MQRRDGGPTSPRRGWTAALHPLGGPTPPRRGGMAAPHPLEEEGWRPHTPFTVPCWWCLCSSPVRSRVPLFTFAQLESGVHCQGRHGAEVPSVSGKRQLLISRPFSLWESETEGCKLCFLYAPVLRSPWTDGRLVAPLVAPLRWAKEPSLPQQLK